MCIVVTLQQRTPTHIFCEVTVSVYTKFSEERSTILHNVNEKPWQWYRCQSPNLTYVPSGAPPSGKRKRWDTMDGAVE